MTNPPEPPPYPGDDPGLPSYGSVPPPPPPGGGVPPPPPPPTGPVGPGPVGPGLAGPVQNQKALAAMIFGLISIPFMCCGCIGVATGITSLTLGILGRKEIRASGGTQTGDGMALAGIIIGIIAIVTSIVLAVLAVALNLPEFAELDSDSFAP